MSLTHNVWSFFLFLGQFIPHIHLLPATLWCSNFVQCSTVFDKGDRHFSIYLPLSSHSGETSNGTSDFLDLLNRRTWFQSILVNRHFHPQQW